MTDADALATGQCSYCGNVACGMDHRVDRDALVTPRIPHYEPGHLCAPDCRWARDMAQAREATLTEAITVCREIEARDLGGEEWLHARRCAVDV